LSPARPHRNRASRLRFAPATDSSEGPKVPLGSRRVAPATSRVLLGREAASQARATASFIYTLSTPSVLTF